MGYITYVTDQRPGEPDILTGNTFADLEICDSDGHLLLKVSAPEVGWTHESLNLVQPQEVQEGNDAFIVPAKNGLAGGCAVTGYI
ncbi:TPA: hypothetical protein ACYEL6_004209 [Escherichia coli]